MSHCCDHQHPNPTTPAPSGDSNPHPAGARLSRFRIEQMDCPTEQGLIERVHGRGTFVRSGIPGASMLRFFRFGDEWDAAVPASAASAGQAPQSRILSKQRVAAPAEVSRALGLPAGAPVLRLERLRHAPPHHMGLWKAVLQQQHGARVVPVGAHACVQGDAVHGKVARLKALPVECVHGQPCDARNLLRLPMA